MLSKKLVFGIIAVILIIAVFAIFVLDDIVFYFNYEKDNRIDLPRYNLKTPIRPFYGEESIVHVKMVDLKHNFSHEKRSEYCFEVIEWIRGGNGESEISAYGVKGYEFKAWGSIEYFEEYRYEIGQEYILLFDNKSSFYKMLQGLYFPLENFEIRAHYYEYNLVDFLHKEENMPLGLSKEEIIEFIRMLAYKEY